MLFLHFIAPSISLLSKLVDMWKTETRIWVLVERQILSVISESKHLINGISWGSKNSFITFYLRFLFLKVSVTNLSVSCWMFQRSLFLGITKLLTWLKSTLLLKIKCFYTHIYMKTDCLQTNIWERKMLEKQVE